MNHSRHYETCGAPLCQEDTSGDIWYPDEDICSVAPFTTWQKTQRKIKRRYDAGTLKDANQYFTISLLTSLTRITDSVKGYDPAKRVAQVASDVENSTLRAVMVGSDIKKVQSTTLKLTKRLVREKV